MSFSLKEGRGWEGRNSRQGGNKGMNKICLEKEEPLKWMEYKVVGIEARVSTAKLGKLPGEGPGGRWDSVLYIISHSFDH